MGLSRTVSEINGNFSRKSQVFPTPVYFMPPLKGSPQNWVSALGVKKLECWATRPKKKFDDLYSAICIQSTNVRWMDRRTDGHRATAKTALTPSITL